MCFERVVGAPSPAEAPASGGSPAAAGPEPIARTRLAAEILRATAGCPATSTSGTTSAPPDEEAPSKTPPARCRRGRRRRRPPAPPSRCRSTSRSAAPPPPLSLVRRFRAPRWSTSRVFLTVDPVRALGVGHGRQVVGDSGGRPLRRRRRRRRCPLHATGADGRELGSALAPQGRGREQRAERRAARRSDRLRRRSAPRARHCWCPRRRKSVLCRLRAHAGDGRQTSIEHIHERLERGLVDRVSHRGQNARERHTAAPAKGQRSRPVARPRAASRVEMNSIRNSSARYSVTLCRRLA